jgi:uncharacterized protein YqgC (DUF456 family)
MDVIWITLGIVLMLAGLAGCVLPFLPGPPLCFVALLIQQMKNDPPFSSKFLWIWLVVTGLVVVLEYIIPVYGTKRYGGTRFGMWGCMIGLIFGFWFGPLGIIIGPFLGALVGELIGNANSDLALRAAFGSFIGFLVSTLLKLIVCFVMTYYFIVSIF